MIKKEELVFGKVVNYEYIHKFDVTLEKACKIAEKKLNDNSFVYGEEAFYKIMEYLQQYLIESGIKIDDFICRQID
jgi:hypothetical protein